MNGWMDGELGPGIINASEENGNTTKKRKGTEIDIYLSCLKEVKARNKTNPSELRLQSGQ